MKHKIKEIRTRKGLTQKDVAILLGITPQGVSSIENSDSVTLNTLEKVAAALGCSVLDLIPHKEKNGILTFENGEAFDMAHASIVNAAMKKDNEYMEQLSVPALKLNDTGRELLLNDAEKYAAIKELTE